MSKTTKIKIHYINFSCSTHATEDIEKVVDAMLNLLPESLREEKEISVVNLEGHAGNPIRLMELELKRQQEIKKTIKYLSEKIDDFDKIFLYEELDNRLDDENSFYFRVNKQAALEENLTVAQDDNTIRIVVKFILYKESKDKLKEFIHEIGLVKKE